MASRVFCRRRLCRAILSLVLMGMASGCSSFPRGWNRPADLGMSGLAGRWEGRWRSEKNGHQGSLRCVIVPAAGSEGVYDARFKAVFWGVFRAGYRVPMTVRVVGDRIEFVGESDLGWFGGGVYTYRGGMEGDRFEAQYESKADRGIFEMTRVRP